MSRARAVHARRCIGRSVAKFRRELEQENGIEIDPHYLRHPQGHHRFYDLLGASRAGRWLPDPECLVPIEVHMLADDLTDDQSSYPIEPHRIPRRMRP